MSTQIEEQIQLNTETVLEDDDPILSHIVGPTDNMTGAEAVMQARVYGTPVTALCGHTWVPSRNPENHPVCQKCIEIVEFDREMR